MAKEKWRPENWENPFSEVKRVIGCNVERMYYGEKDGKMMLITDSIGKLAKTAYEDGADAILKALGK